METPKAERVKLASHLVGMLVLSNLLAEYDTVKLLKSASDGKHKTERVKYASLLLAFQQEKRAFVKALAKGLMGGAKMLGKGLMGGGQAAGKSVVNAGKAAVPGLKQTANGLGRVAKGVQRGLTPNSVAGSNALPTVGRAPLFGAHAMKGVRSGVDSAGGATRFPGTAGSGAFIANRASNLLRNVRPGMRQTTAGLSKVIGSHPLNTAAAAGGIAYAGNKASPVVQSGIDKVRSGVNTVAAIPGQARNFGNRLNKGLSQAGSGISQGFNTVAGG